MKELKLSITHFKILHTIKTLNDMKLFPKQEGVYKIVHGTIDEETETLKDIPTFGTIISYNSKKVSRYVLALNRYGYVAKIFDRETKDLYLTLTEKGRIELAKFLDKHPKEYSKKKKEIKKTIVKIGE